MRSSMTVSHMRVPQRSKTRCTICEEELDVSSKKRCDFCGWKENKRRRAPTPSTVKKHNMKKQKLCDVEFQKEGKGCYESSVNVAHVEFNDEDAIGSASMPVCIPDNVALDAVFDDESEGIFDEAFNQYISMFHPELVDSPLRVHSSNQPVNTLDVSDTYLLESLDSFIESDMIGDLNSFFA